MTTDSKTSPTYDESKATISFDPSKYTYTQSDDYTDALNQLKDLIGASSSNASDLYNLGSSYVTNALSSDYSAYTPEQLQTMINEQSDEARKQFKTDENRIASHLATSGLAGSGVAGMDWGGQQTRENEAIANIVSNVNNQNLEATRSDKANALNNLSSLSSLSQTPISNYSTYANLLGQNDANQNSWNQWLAQMGLSADTANANAYQNWYNTASQQAAQNQNALGSAIGSIFSK